MKKTKKRGKKARCTRSKGAKGGEHMEINTGIDEDGCTSSKGAIKNKERNNPHQKIIGKGVLDLGSLMYR